MRRVGTAAEASRPPRQRVVWPALVQRLLLDIAPRTPAPRLRARVLERLRGRG